MERMNVAFHLSMQEHWWVAPDHGDLGGFGRPPPDLAGPAPPNVAGSGERCSNICSPPPVPFVVPARLPILSMRSAGTAVMPSISHRTLITEMKQIPPQ